MFVLRASRSSPSSSLYGQRQIAKLRPAQRSGKLNCGCTGCRWTTFLKHLKQYQTKRCCTCWCSPKSNGRTRRFVKLQSDQVCSCEHWSLRREVCVSEGEAYLVESRQCNQCVIGPLECNSSLLTIWSPYLVDSYSSDRSSKKICLGCAIMCQEVRLRRTIGGSSHGRVESTRMFLEASEHCNSMIAPAVQLQVINSNYIPCSGAQQGRHNVTQDRTKSIKFVQNLEDKHANRKVRTNMKQGNRETLNILKDPKHGLEAEPSQNDCVPREQTWTNKSKILQTLWQLFGSSWFLLSPFLTVLCFCHALHLRKKRMKPQLRGTWVVWHFSTRGCGLKNPKNIFRDWGFCVSTSKKEAPTSSRHHQSTEEQNTAVKKIINSQILSNYVKCLRLYETVTHQMSEAARWVSSQDSQTLSISSLRWD